MAGLELVVEDAAPKGAPDLPCPKCGSHDTWMRYCDSNLKHVQEFSQRLCRHGDQEHLHRGCRRCSFSWRTDDLIDPIITDCGRCHIY